MANLVPDLAQFVQRRELLSYEQRAARAAYAYGVDLRRSAWLDHSTLGEPMMSAVDRRWNALTRDLQAEVLDDPNVSPPTPILEELARLLRLLRAPLPTLRRLRPSVSRDDWPPITPLGTTLGGTHWLVLDIERLLELPDHERTFLLGSALGNLQCDHGAVYAAHLMAHRASRGFGLVKTLLRPWSRVAPFSADRAGLLAVGDLEPALDALRSHADPGLSWWPPLPPATLRITALQDFDRSRVMTRLRLTYENHRDWTVTPADPAQPAQGSEAGAATGAPAAAATARATAEQAPIEPPTAEDRARRMHATAAGSFEISPEEMEHDSNEDVVEQVQREAENIEREREREEAQRDASLDEQAVAERLRKSWPLARVDARLTRRLGLL